MRLWLRFALFFLSIFRCVVLNAKEAEDRFILNVHSKKHVNLIKNISSKEFDSRRNKIAAKFNSIYFNEGSSESAYLAAGSVVDVISQSNSISTANISNSILVSVVRWKMFSIFCIFWCLVRRKNVSQLKISSV